MSYSELVKAAEDFLHEKGGKSQSGRSVAEHLEKLMNEGKLPEYPRNTILAYLSKAANRDENSRIVSGGPYGGYSLENEAVPPEAAPVTDITIPSTNLGGDQFGEQTQIQIKEKHLYPLIEAWLKANDYTARDVSALKAGGTWGNPDLLGVSRVEILGTTEIELVSVEVKLNESNWERFIFESISHKRFVNRSWYCYRTSLPYPPLPKSMAYYAERYKVGIIQIHLNDQELAQIAEKPGTSVEYLDRVLERVRALHEPVPLQEKRAFLERAKINIQLNLTSTFGD